MNFSFHYATIKFLARLAGFPDGEAQIIAYASQYVDDSTEHRPFYVQNLPRIHRLRFDKYGRFEPTCTAHYKLDDILNPSPEVQHKVFIPFHFLPSGLRVGESRLPPTYPDPVITRTPKKPDYSDRDFDWQTQRGSILARAVLDEALGAVKFRHDERERFLIKLGIALHTYADTWAHQGFSGRNCQDENDVQAIKEKRGKNWFEVRSPLMRLLDRTRFIGHLQAGRYPDRPWHVWDLQKAGRVDWSYRDNSLIFVNAANAIYRQLRKIRSLEPEGLPLESEHVLLRLFKQRIPCPDLFYRWRTLRQWRKAIPSVFFAYDPGLWRDQALHEHQFIGDHKYFYFHAEAYVQRQFVLTQLEVREK